MSITGGASGTGTGVVGVGVAANTGTDSRTGTFTIAGQAVAVTQKSAAVSCSYDLAPSTQAFGKDGGAGSFAVTAPAGCAWSASTTDGWISVSSSSAADGNGTVQYNVARNSQLDARAGAISVAGRRFEVSQAGDTGLCEYRVSPVELSPCMAATEITTSIVTDATCSWTVTPDASWLSVVGGTSGRGPATITIKVAENWDLPRLGLLMVRWPTPTAGQNVRVAQAGCRYAVSTASIAVVGAGGAARFDVYQQSDPYTCGGPLQNGCMWTAQADVPWIVVNTSMPQFGDNPVSLTIAPNDAATARSGNVRVRDQLVQITQAGR
jgi:Viral BACON domain/Putative binding domain, N-terminal